MTDLQITDTRISFDEADIADSGTITVGNVLQVTGIGFDVKGFSYTTGPSGGLSATSAAITAGSVNLSIGNGAATGTVTGFGGSYSFGTGDLNISATDVHFSVGNVLTVDATSFTFQLDPLKITAATATALSSRFGGVGGEVDNVVITDDGFSCDDATLGATGTVSLGSVFTFTNLKFTLTNFGYSTSNGASFGVYDSTAQPPTFKDSVFTVTADSAALNIGSAFTASATGINGSIDLSSDNLGDFTFSADTVTVKVGSYLKLDASTINFDPGASGSTDIADFGSIDAKLNVGGLSIDGSAQNFGIDSSGDFVTQPGFGVSFTVGASNNSSVQSGINWPSWLPIQISHLSLSWPDFTDKPTDFTIDLSASVNTTFGSVSVNGFVDNAVIDTGLLAEGKFPLIGLGGAGIQAGGTMFGATIRGQLFLSMLREAKSGAVIADNDNITPVASSVLYGGIDAAINLEGEDGFEVRLGVSQLGPLQAYVSVADPVVLEPISGLALTDFAAGIQFDTTLPSISDARQMANDPEFTPTSQLTLQQWKSELQTAVKNQATVAASGGDIWDQLTQPMTLEGSVTLFDAHATEGAFKLAGDFKFDTVGHFFAQGDLVMGGTLNL
ncbi:MAG TPA: hypothetical protein PK867_00690, partial [Pirellulales bacterium]|nr:hypothetical protein [Pirellulales bacterium]